jgi:hypothetical protein
MRVILIALGIIESTVAFAVEESSTTLLEARLDVVHERVGAFSSGHPQAVEYFSNISTTTNTSNRTV